MANLMDEFEIHYVSKPLFSIGGHDIAITNSSIFMFLTIIAATLFMTLSMRRRALVPGRWQMMAEGFYNFSSDMLTSVAGPKAMPFFPFIFTIFAFVLFSNLFGLFPMSLAITAHIIINFAIAILLFTVIIITGFIRHGFRFLTVFVPPGAPKLMLPFLVFIELVSYLARPFSLSIRLFANMLAGHVLLQVFAGMTVSLLAAGWLAGLSILPLLANIAMTAFEFFVAFLQAYIYAILSSVYLRDALELHTEEH